MFDENKPIPNAIIIETHFKADQQHGVCRVRCPYCFNDHGHGSILGHRWSHCSDDDLEGMDLKRTDITQGYNIINPNNLPLERLK